MKPLNHFLALSILQALLVARAPAGDSLARYIPQDAGLYLEVQDLAAQWKLFSAGGLFVRWQTFPPAAAWTATKVPQAAQFVAEIDRQLDIRSADVWQQALGRRSALAVWPPQKNQAEVPRGLLVVEAEDDRLLPQLLDGLKRAQKRRGELLEYREATHAGSTYRVHVVQRGGKRAPFFAAALGRLGLLASDELLMQRALELLKQSPEQPAGLAALPAYRAAQQHWEATAAIRAFVNPRTWDESLQAVPASSNPIEARNQKLLLAAWAVTQHVSTSLQLTPQLSWQFHCQFEKLPAGDSLAAWLDSFSGETDGLDRAPADCLAVAAGRMDVGRLLQGLGQAVQDPQSGKTNPALIAWGLMEELFAGAGPDFSFFISPVAQQQKLQNGWPVDLVLTLQTQSRAGAAAGAQAHNPHEVLRTLALLAATANNLQHEAMAAQVKQIKEQDQHLTQIVGLHALPAGKTATFAHAQQRLYAGTSAAAVARTMALHKDQSLAARWPLALAGRTRPPASHILYVNFAAARRLIANHAESLANLVAASKSIPVQQAQQGIAQMQALLRLADEALVAAKIDPAQITIQLTLAAE